MLKIKTLREHAEFVFLTTTKIIRVSQNSWSFTPVCCFSSRAIYSKRDNSVRSKKGVRRIYPCSKNVSFYRLFWVFSQTPLKL